MIPPGRMKAVAAAHMKNTLVIITVMMIIK
jgi:hypothetical protein